MPTLPGRENSILKVFAKHDGASTSPARSFDWRALVQEARPGGATESQRAQGARFARIRQDVQRWASERGVSHEHLEESSFYAVACAAPTTTHEQAVALALGVYWIYLLDDFLDRRDFAALGNGARSGLAALDRDLGVILAPLATYAAGRGLAVQAGDPASGDGATLPTGEHLRAALCSVMGALERAWAPTAGDAAAMRDRRRLIAQEFGACATAMRQEARWNAALARDPVDPELPRFADYLLGGATSIGMPAVAAMAASFEAQPQAAWRAARAAIAAGGAVVRLTNDLHTYFADVEEGKVSAITIRLRELGYPPTGAHPDTSAQVREAQVSVGEELARAVEGFGRARVQAPDGPLAHCVSHAVAFALAVYGDGSQFRKPAA